MFAGFRKLDNLVVIVDNNGLQIDGKLMKYALHTRSIRNLKHLISM